MSDFDYDLFVIGGGSGGVRAARRAAEAGARVALAEEYRCGGTCVIRGCIPKKLMVYAASFPTLFATSAGYGWDVAEPTFDWVRFKQNRDAEVARLEGVYQGILQNAGVDRFDARATIAEPHAVRVAGREELVRARHILVATGGHPHVPTDFPGHELAISSNGVFELEQLPRRMLVVGGGYIACEFTSIFCELGVNVTHVYRGAPVLRGFDDDLRAFATAELQAQGVELLLNETVSEIRRDGDELTVQLGSGETRTTDVVLYATGRTPNTAELGLATAGVEIGSRGEVLVDEYSASNVPSIHAVGDATNRVNLTPVAIREAEAFVSTVFGGTPTAPDHELVASAVFTKAELGTVGLTEAAARATGEVEVFRTEFNPLLQTLGSQREPILFKLVVDKASQRVLGVHLGGHGAAELIQCLAIAVKMGATKADFDRTCAVHPTAAEEIVTLREPVLG